MAAMSNTLTEFADNGNSRTSTLSAHTALKPALVIQKRTVAQQANQSAEDNIQVVYGTVDADGAPIAARVVFSVNFRRPMAADADDITAALAVFRDIIASDNFANTVQTQEWL